MTDILTEAYEFAKIAHHGQTRKGVEKRPYITHIAEVAGLVSAWGSDEASICAAYLHDTVEDCDVSLSEVEARFGPQVASIVAEVTDDRSLDKPARKAAQLAHAPQKSNGAARIKLADKTSNLLEITRAPGAGWDASRKLAYVDWAEAVVAALPQSALPRAGLRGFRDAADVARSYA